MPSPIDICLNNNTTAIPCTPNDAEALAIFRKDNPHITGNSILSGTPYIVRNGAIDSSHLTINKA
ncbi:MAG: hypothetical protein HRU20_26960 [Pseudomonadales bacterium]|nr:hypothetical protein [Pseudomonadales bacterium]